MEENLENMIQDKIKALQSFTEAEIKLYIFQIFKGLEYIHAKSSYSISRYCPQGLKA